MRGGLLPPIPPEVAGAAPEHHDLLRAGLVTTPWRCFVEPIVLAQEPTIPRTYVWCTQSGFGGVAARVRADGGWDYRELDTLHMCMYSAPEAVAELLLDCAA